MIKPGFYPDMTREEYDALGTVDILNYSTIKVGRAPKGTMYDLHAQMHRKQHKPTAAMILGTATHRRCYEPHRFQEMYCEEPPVPEGTTRNRKAYKDAKAELEADGNLVLTSDDMFAVEGMWRSLKSEPTAAHLLERDSHYEATIIWNDVETGVLLKARVDELCLAEAEASDLKTASKEHDIAFKYAIGDYAYDIQAAMTIDGLHELDMYVRRWVWPVVRKTWPFTPNVIVAPAATIAAAREDYRAILRQVVECRKTGVWPAHGGRHVPDWEDSSIDYVPDEDYANKEELNDAI